MIEKIITAYITVLIVLFFPLNVFAADIFVSTPVNAKNINSAITKAKPGDRVIIPDGTYADLGQIVVPNVINGKKGSPITLKAATEGGVTFTGEPANGYVILIKGEWWIIKDFEFLDISKGGTAHSRGIFVNADNVRITNNYFGGFGNSSTRKYDWVIWIGNHANADYCRIDHNTFSNNKAKCVMTNAKSGGSVASYTRIDHNHFLDAHPKATSYIMIGSGGNQANEDIATYVTVEKNVFENHNAPGEPVNNKSSYNTIQYNIFRSARGRTQKDGIVLRGGNHVLVRGNYFFNNDGQNIRVHDTGHTIINNHFENPGYAAILLADGNGGKTYDNVSDILIANNTIVGVTVRGIDVGWWTSGNQNPNNLTFKDNIIKATSGYCIRDGGHSGIFAWIGNKFYATGSAGYWSKIEEGSKAPKSGITYTNVGVAIDPPISISEVGVSWLRQTLKRAELEPPVLKIKK